MGRVFLVLYRKVLGHPSEVPVLWGVFSCISHLGWAEVTSCQLAGVEKPTVNHWSLCLVRHTFSSHSLLCFEQPFFSGMWGFIFFLLNLTLCLKFPSSLCVCFYRQKGPFCTSSACHFAGSLNIRNGDQGQNPGVQRYKRNRNRKWNPTRRWKKQ